MSLNFNISRSFDQNFKIVIMKNTIKKFGTYGFLIGGIIFVAGHFFDNDIDFGTLEIYGYVSIFASLSFVYFGIKHFRDKENKGIVSFKNALLIGLAISAIVGLVIGILDVIYVTLINPDFANEYVQYVLDGMKDTLSVEEFEIKKAKLMEQMELYNNPSFAGFIMFVTVFAIGIIISLISSLILQRKK